MQFHLRLCTQEVVLNRPFALLRPRFSEVVCATLTDVSSNGTAAISLLVNEPEVPSGEVWPPVTRWYVLASVGWHYDNSLDWVLLASMPVNHKTVLPLALLELEKKETSSGGE